MLTFEEFKRRFHALGGITAAEKQRNFRKLLDQVALIRNNPCLLDDIVKKLEPDSHLKRMFHLDLLIYFRRSQDIINELKDGNDILMKKLARQRWFFQNAFSDFSVDALVNTVLAEMSYSIRTKILTKLSRNVDETRFDKIFDAIEERYGIYQASKYITGCTPGKIREFMCRYPMKITNRHLYMFYQKDPDLVDFSLQHAKVIGYHIFFKYLLSANWDLFDELTKKYSIVVKLCSSSTKKYVDKYRDEILRDPIMYIRANFLHWRTTFHRLGPGIIDAFRKSVPPTIEGFLAINLTALMKLYPRKYHQKMFFKVIPELYGKRYEDYPMSITVSLLDIMPVCEERAALARMRVDAGLSRFLKYLPIDEAILRIKDKIDLCESFADKLSYVNLLVEACHVNHNQDALVDIIWYVSTYFENEQNLFHLDFLICLEKYFPPRKYTASLWRSIEDFLMKYTRRLSNDPSIVDSIKTLPLVKFHRCNFSLILAWLEFKFLKGESIPAIFARTFFPYLISDFRIYNKNFEKSLLIFALENQHVFSYNRSIDDFCYFFKILKRWNRCYRRDQLYLKDFPRLVRSFEYFLNNVHINVLTEEMVDLIFTTFDNPYTETLTYIYWLRFDKIGTYEHMMWFLKNRPQAVIPHIEKFLGIVLQAPVERQIKTWAWVKKYQHLGLDRKIIDLCVNNFEVSNNKTDCILFCIAMLMKTADFVSLASVGPRNEVAWWRRFDVLKKTRFQMSIAKSFKYIRPVSCVVKVFIEFCRDDDVLFEVALGALFSMTAHLPEPLQADHFQHLYSVDLIKYVVYLTCDFSTVTSAVLILQTLHDTKAWNLVEKQGFNATWNYFKKNPLDSIYNIFKLNVNFIATQHANSLGYLVYLFNRVPLQFRSSYMKLIWDHLTSARKYFHMELKAQLLSSVDVDVARLIEAEFGLKIIKQYFLTTFEGKTLQPDVLHNFMFIFLLNNSRREELLRQILTMLSERPNRYGALNFFLDWYRKIMCLKREEVQFFQLFCHHWRKILHPVDDFCHWMLLFFLEINIAAPDDCLDFVSQEIVNKLTMVISESSPYILEIFVRQVETSLHYFTKPGASIYHYCDKWITLNPIPPVFIMVMTIMPAVKPDNREEFSIYEGILLKLKYIQDTAVRIYLQTKFSQHYKPKSVIQDLTLEPERGTSGSVFLRSRASSNMSISPTDLNLQSADSHSNSDPEDLNAYNIPTTDDDEDNPGSLTPES